MAKFSVFVLLLLLCGRLMSEEASTTSNKEGLKQLPDVKESAPPPKIKNSNLTKPSDLTFPSSSTENTNRRPTYTKEQLEAINKERNWAVEGLKERREIERLELEKMQLEEKDSLNVILEKERKSIDERLAKSTSSMSQFKPSIENSWSSNTLGITDAEKDMAERTRELLILSQAQNSLMGDSLNSPKESIQAFDSPTISSGNNSSSMNSLQQLQNQMNGTKAKTESNFDYLVNTGQASNFRKLSNDPNFQPPSVGILSPQPSINAVPSVPKPVTSTMSLETMRQVELQRVNAIPKPDFKEINSRIPDPGARRF